MKKILVVGSINFDQIFYVEDFPKPGETIVSTKNQQLLGGKGANQAVALKKLGANVIFKAKVGSDYQANFVLAELSKYQLDLGNIEKSTNSSTGMASIYVNQDGENSIVLISGANADFTAEDADSYKSLIASVDYVVLQLETNEQFVLAILKLSKQLKKITVLNPAPAKKIDASFWNYCDYLIPNESEFAILFNYPTIANESELITAIMEVAKTHPMQLIVTYGSEGVYFVQNHQVQHQKPPSNLKVIDTTAAGDSFIAGFVLQLSKGSTLAEAIAFGITVASITITREGGAQSIPTYQEVQNV